MSTFRRGPICGVDNCPSRLWRNIDGRRTCQYGHIMEGDIEFDDDGENLGVGTRRIRLTTDSRGAFQSSQLQASQSQSLRRPDEDILYGSRAKLHFITCLQTILVQQIKETVREFPGLSQETFQEVVKSLWIRYLQNVEEDETTGLTIMSNICFIYLAFDILGIPITSHELYDKILNLKITYVQSLEFLPQRWIKKLPNYYLQKLNGQTLWKELKFYRKIHVTCHRMRFNEFCEQRSMDGKFPWDAFLIKIILRYRLPLGLYDTVKQVSKDFSLANDNDNIVEIHKKNIRPSSTVYFNEIRCLSLILICIRVFIQCQRIDDQYITKWISLNRDISSTQKNGNYMLKTDFYNTEVPHHEEQENDYLSWMEREVLPKFDKLSNDKGTLTLDEKIVLKKLYNMIPVDDTNERADDPTSAAMREITINSTNNDLVNSYKHLYNSSDSSDPTPESVPIHNSFETKLVEMFMIDFNLSVETLQYSVNKLSSLMK